MSNRFLTRNKSCPCVKECPARHPGCHDACEKYQAWKAELNAWKDNKIDFKTKESYVFDFMARKRKGEH